MMHFSAFPGWRAPTVWESASKQRPARYYYAAKAFVDASGDGDLLARAGAEMVERPENALTFWMLSTGSGTDAERH